MSSSRTHLALGITAGLTGLSLGLSPNLKEYIPAIILGSSMPDIDTAKSWVAQAVPFVDDTLRKAGLLKHRGFTHGITGIITISLLLLMFRNDLMLGFSIGYICHCLTDVILGKLRIESSSKKFDKGLYNIAWIINTLMIGFLIYERWFA